MKNILKIIGLILVLILVGLMVLKYPPYPIPTFNDSQIEHIQNEEWLK